MTVALFPAALLIATIPAAAQFQTRSALRQTIIEDPVRSGGGNTGKDEWAGIVAVGTGFTTNAGPSLIDRASAVTETSLTASATYAFDQAQLAVTAEVLDRQFLQQNDARNFNLRLRGSFVQNIGKGGAISLSAYTANTVELNEEITEIGVEAERTWQPFVSSLAPFAQLSVAHLNYADLPSPIFEFGNQDDRDRVSTTALAGIKYQASPQAALTFAAGADVKTYLARTDDFGLKRDNFSVFPQIGIAYASGPVSGSLSYAPVLRNYQEKAFRSAIAHTATARAMYQPEDKLTLTASGRMGLEETDFLTAQSIEDYEALIALHLTRDTRAAASFEAIYSCRNFLGFERSDRKLELIARGQLPITRSLFATGYIKHLQFASTFADAALSSQSVLIGIAYVLN